MTAPFTKQEEADVRRIGGDMHERIADRLWATLDAERAAAAERDAAAEREIGSLQSALDHARGDIGDVWVELDPWRVAYEKKTAPTCADATSAVIGHLAGIIFDGPE